MNPYDKRDLYIELKLKRPIPPERSYEQLRNHFLVEKSIAARIMQSTRTERALLYKTMYDELFSFVPDHPRLTRQSNDDLQARINEKKFVYVKKFINSSTKLVEFAPGDCSFSMELANKVKFVYGVDISNQSKQSNRIPENFKLIIYDGYNLQGINFDSIDLVFSDQLIEHFHPEDTQLHFELVYRLLRTSGKYVFHTPHYLTGPSDISSYFSDEPVCFHLKEWTFSELRMLLKGVGFLNITAYWKIKGSIVRVPYIYFELCEKILSLFPKPKIRTIAELIIRSILIIVEK